MHCQSRDDLFLIFGSNGMYIHWAIVRNKLYVEVHMLLLTSLFSVEIHNAILVGYIHCIVWFSRNIQRLFAWVYVLFLKSWRRTDLQCTSADMIFTFHYRMLDKILYSIQYEQYVPVYRCGNLWAGVKYKVSYCCMVCCGGRCIATTNCLYL